MKQIILSLFVAVGLIGSASTAPLDLGFYTNNTTTIISTTTNVDNVTLGTRGKNNSLIVTNGGKIINRMAVSFGNETESISNSVVVTGSNSLFSNDNYTQLGWSGSGNMLIVSNGATYISPQGVIIGGGSTGSNNTVIVTGSGSTLSADTDYGSVFLQGDGYGNSLTIADNAQVTANSIRIRSRGTLNIGSNGISSLAGSPNVKHIATETFGSDSSQLNFNQANALTVTSSISGNGTINQLGSGTTILSASNSFYGTTYVSAGTMLINYSSASNTVTVSSGGTLGGTGSMGDVTIQNGGTLSTTNSFGQMNVASLTLASNSIIKVAVTGTNSTQFDSIYAAGSIAFGGSFNINMSGSYNSTNNIGMFKLFSNDSGLLGSSSNNFAQVNITGSYNGSLVYYSQNNVWQLWDGTSSYIGLNMTTGQLTVVPEPSTYALFGIGAIGILMVLRRKKTA